LSYEGLSAAKAELLGALTGDRGAFKKTHSYGHYKGYDATKWVRYVTKVCVGLDKEWGFHLSDLVFHEYGLHGSVYWDRNEWRFASSSARLFRGLACYYEPAWNARCWRISPVLFESPIEVRQAFIRGYFDADGYPYFNKARNKVLVQVNSVNYSGLSDAKNLFESLDYHPGLYRRYKVRNVWELTIHRKNEIMRFLNEIGFSIERKQAKLRKMLKVRWPESIS
jgi:intein/homing endonuclease